MAVEIKETLAVWGRAVGSPNYTDEWICVFSYHIKYNIECMAVLHHVANKTANDKALAYNFMSFNE